jgi:hypothetical protein
MKERNAERTGKGKFLQSWKKRKGQSMKESDIRVKGRRRKWNSKKRKTLNKSREKRRNILKGYRQVRYWVKTFEQRIN